MLGGYCRKGTTNVAGMYSQVRRQARRGSGQVDIFMQLQGELPFRVFLYVVYYDRSN